MDKGSFRGMMSIDFLGAADHSYSHGATIPKRKREPLDSPVVAAGAARLSASIHEMDFFAKPPSVPAFPGAVKKEELADDGGGGSAAKLINICDVNTGLNLSTAANTRSDQSTVDDGSSPLSHDKESKTEEMASLQLELNRMNEENRRLKEMLNQMSSNYNALQMQLFNFMQQQQHKKGSEMDQPKPISDRLDQEKDDLKVVPRQFMDLGPVATVEMEQEHSESSSEGRTESASPRKDEFRQQGIVKATASNEIVSFENTDGGDGRRSAREDSSEQGSQGWAPNKAPRLAPAKSDDQSNEATLRKARVSVRARSEASMISDGCQWRKYGQKMAKGNPCPRAYYRCTMAAGCPVRKQVQRCAEDQSILITTYEGSHNHPLPPAAVAMASTTSAAASMLLSGSMSSTDGGLMNANFLARTVLPCSSSMATISASAPFPTVTLDLTNTPNPLQFQRPPTQFPVPFAGIPQGFPAPPAAPLPQIFGQSLYNQSKFSGLHVSPNVDVPSQFTVPQLPPIQGPPSSLADTVSAATAAITADPNFTAVLAAAITSIIGGGAPAQLSAINNDNKQ